MTTTPPRGSDLGGRVPVYILAGGKSRRFGRDKARALHQGVPLVTHAADTLRPIASAVTVVAAESGAYNDLGLRTIGDVVADRGPVGGLLSAIEDCGQGWLFLSACDWVGIRVEWARGLIAKARSTSARAVAFRSDRWEPLFALYHTSIRDDVAGILQGDHVSMRALLTEIAVLTVAAPSGWSGVVNLNRPTEDS